MIELRFVKRQIPTDRNLANDGPVIVREVKILQMRTLDCVVIKTAERKWHEWTDVPLVEPEDER